MPTLTVSGGCDCARVAGDKNSRKHRSSTVCFIFPGYWCSGLRQQDTNGFQKMKLGVSLEVLNFVPDNCAAIGLMLSRLLSGHTCAVEKAMEQIYFVHKIVYHLYC